MDDPIVAEIRRIRDAHSRRFNYDLAAICADIRKHQGNYGHRVVRLRRKQQAADSQSNSVP